MSEEPKLNEIEEIEKQICNLSEKVLTLKHDYLISKGWSIESEYNYINLHEGRLAFLDHVYCKDDIVTIDIDTAMEKQSELYGI